MLSSTVQTLLRSPLFIISTTALVCLLLSASLLQHQHTQRLDLRTAHYGNALASLAAKQATDATLNHDLVSLQVTVSDVARNPHILNSTIHDVESRLLVQAGESPNTGNYTQRDHRSYTAPITLHDSVAGYVTVTVDSQALFEQQDDSWLLALLGLAAALLVLSLLNVRQGPSSAKNTDNSGAQSELQLSPATAATEQLGDDAIIISLCFQCINWPTLKQQLGNTLKQQLFEDLQSQLSGINTLYSGRVEFAQEDFVELQFIGDDLGNTTFRAICAAQLFFQLLNSRCAGIQLQYASAVYRSEKASVLKQHIHNHRRQQQLATTLQSHSAKTLLLDGQDCATSQLLQRVQVQPELIDGHWFAVEGLQPSYQGLLDKQAKQLQGLQEA